MTSSCDKMSYRLSERVPGSIDRNMSDVRRYRLLCTRACECKGVRGRVGTLDIRGNTFTGMKQCTFHLLISNDIAQKEMVLDRLISHNLIMMTCISYEIIFTISLPKWIDIAPFQTCVIHVTDSIIHCNTDYSGLEWSNIKTFWYKYGKYISIADAGNHN